MTEPLSPDDLSSLLDELNDASPGITFSDSAPEEEIAVAAEEAPAEEDRTPQPFAFGRDGAPSAERLAGLERMGEKLARAFRPAIEPIARARVTVAAEAPQVSTLQAWQDEQPAFSAISLYRLRPLKGGMLVQVQADFVAALVEIFYGGSAASIRPRKAGDFSASEELLLNRLLEQLTGIVADHWREITPVEIEFAARETNAALVPFLRSEDMVVVQRFTLSAGMQPTTLSLVYPLAMLRPIEEKMDARGPAEEATASEDWRRRLGEALEDVSLPVRTVLARPEISVAEVLALKPGDVIPITLPPRTPLLAGTHRIADGVIGEQDGRAALRIEQIGFA